MPETPIREGQILTGTLFNEPMQVETVRPTGDGAWVAGLIGTKTERFRRVTLTIARFIREASEFVPITLKTISDLPHPEKDSPDIRNIRPNLETEAVAMQVVMDWESAQGRQVYDVHEKDLGYDITTLDINSGELRLIEVKGLAAQTGTILLTPNEKRVAEDRRDCYWLYIATNCATKPIMQEPIKDPAKFPWREVTKVAHYWLGVNAMTKPMMLREDQSPYRD